jgi:hypothetical protein
VSGNIAAMKIKDYDKLDNSIECFKFLKSKSEKHWEHVTLELCWGYQIQEGSKWREGLTENELNDFQQQIGFEFPEPLKNFYRVMNGLDKPGLNNCSGEEEIDYRTTFYSYPDDVEIIKATIDSVLRANSVTPEMYNNGNVSKVFPYYGHRFLILNQDQMVLSMHGSDIIFWAPCLIKGIAKDIFDIQTYRKENLILTPDDFWCDRVG